MAGIPNTTVSPKKKWIAPELKKISIEMITAHHFSSGNDGTGGHTAS